MKRFELILDECLDRIAAGEPIADVVSSYPEYSSSLEPLLRAAQVTVDAGHFEPSEAGLARARDRVAQARISRAARTASAHNPSIGDRLRRLRLPASTIATIAVLALTAVLLVRPTLETGEVPFQPPAEAPSAQDDGPPVDVAGEPSSTGEPSVPDETTEIPAEDVPGTTPVIALPDANGSFTFYVSDLPNDIGDFQELLVTVSCIEMKPHGDGPWVEIIPEPFNIDLVQLQGTRATELWRGDLSEGEYDTVFLSIDAIQGTLASTGEKADVKLPSDRLHIQSRFTVATGEEISYVFDITVHQAGAGQGGPGYILSPQASESGVGREIEPVNAQQDTHGQADSPPGQSDPPVADKPGPGPGQPPRARTVKTT